MSKVNHLSKTKKAHKLDEASRDHIEALMLGIEEKLGLYESEDNPEILDEAAADAKNLVYALESAARECRDSEIKDPVLRRNSNKKKTSADELSNEVKKDKPVEEQPIEEEQQPTGKKQTFLVSIYSTNGEEESNTPISDPSQIKEISSKVVEDFNRKDEKTGKGSVEDILLSENESLESVKAKEITKDSKLVFEATFSESEDQEDDIEMFKESLKGCLLDGWGESISQRSMSETNPLYVSFIDPKTQDVSIELKKDKKTEDEPTNEGIEKEGRRKTAGVTIEFSKRSLYDEFVGSFYDDFEEGRFLDLGQMKIEFEPSATVEDVKNILIDAGYGTFDYEIIKTSGKKTAKNNDEEFLMYVDMAVKKLKQTGKKLTLENIAKQTCDEAYEYGWTWSPEDIEDELAEGPLSLEDIISRGTKTSAKASNEEIKKYLITEMGMDEEEVNSMSKKELKEYSDVASEFMTEEEQDYVFSKKKTALTTWTDLEVDDVYEHPENYYVKDKKGSTYDIIDIDEKTLTIQSTDMTHSGNTKLLYAGDDFGNWSNGTYTLYEIAGDKKVVISEKKDSIKYNDNHIIANAMPRG